MTVRFFATKVDAAGMITPATLVTDLPTDVQQSLGAPVTIPFDEHLLVRFMTPPTQCRRALHEMMAAMPVGQLDWARLFRSDVPLSDEQALRLRRLLRECTALISKSSAFGTGTTVKPSSPVL